jgi:putative DNA primase/helicase
MSRKSTPEEVAEVLRLAGAQERAQQQAAGTVSRNGHRADAEPTDEEHIPPPTEPPSHPESPVNHSGQVRMAYRLANAYRGRLLHVHGIGWHYWDSTRWAADDRGEARRAVLAVLRAALAESLGDKELQSDVRKCESASGVAGVLEIAAALVPFAATVRDLDPDPYLLNCANGTLDLRTMQLTPHNPADRITKVTRAAYDPAAAAVVWRQFIDRVLPDVDVQDYLQRIIGASLFGAVVEHVLPILTGIGANGKGTFTRALEHALGDYASSAEPDLFMHRQNAHPTGEMDLLGRRLVFVSETEQNRRMDEAKMKRLTGGDTVRARRMRQDFIEFRPSHLPLLVTNHLPRVSGDDDATWRRLRVIPFAVSIPRAEWDNGLDEALQAEAAAVLAWAVAGWQHYRTRKLDEPPAVVQATSAYQLASDALGRFIADECVTSSPALKATTGQLHDAWEKWRVTDGAESLSLKAFGLALDRHGYPAGKPVNSKRWRTGIALKVVDDAPE